MDAQPLSFSLDVRLAKESDHAYLAASWLKASSASPGRRIGQGRYATILRPVLAALMARSALYVAHPTGDEDTVLGTLVVETRDDGLPVVHWIYVRNAWRGNGIARGLVTAAGIDPSQTVLFTFWTDAAPTLARKFKTLAYVPAALISSREG